MEQDGNSCVTQMMPPTSFTDSTPNNQPPAEFRPLLNLRETIMHICRQQHTLYKDREISFVGILDKVLKSYLPYIPE